MGEPKKIQVRRSGRIVDAVLLGVYNRPYYRFRRTLWERLLFRKTKSKTETLIRKTYLVFLPWKHREKQLEEITEPEALPFEKTFPEEWISIPEFVSEGTEELRPSVTVRDFFGYRFLCENPSFICNQICGLSAGNLEILYSEMPELLNEEFDEERCPERTETR